MGIFEKENHINFFLLAGSKSNLATLDFSHLNIRILALNSDEFDSILKDSSFEEDWYPRNRELLFADIKKDLIEDYMIESLYVLMPIDLSVIVETKYYYECWTILLIMFPSVLSIYADFMYQIFDNRYLWQIGSTQYRFYQKNQFEDYLHFEESNITSINKFIVLYFSRISNLKYVKSAIDSYKLSFHSNLYSMSYISLCICLETLVEGSIELSYRIKRTVAVLCSKNENIGLIIFKNIDNIYKLRSKIVHGAEVNSNKIDEYRPYLRMIVSKIIVELIIHNISTLIDLNYKITSIGFGDRQKLSTAYSSLVLSTIMDEVIDTKKLSAIK